MLVKGLLILCVQAVLYKAVLAQCIGPILPPGEVLLPNMAFEGLAPIAPVIGRVVGGNLVVDTSAPEPSGVSIVSENLIIEGTVFVSGNLPFLGTVALDGIVPASGRSAVSYECGAGNIGITSDVPVAEIPPIGLGLTGVNRIGVGRI